MVVDQTRAFQCNNVSKDKTVYNYVCNERLTVGVKCKAKAVVMKCDIPKKGVKYVLVKVDTDHDCPQNMPKAIADEMKYNMKKMVRKEPQKPVGDSVRTVINLFSENLDYDDDLFDNWRENHIWYM